MCESEMLQLSVILPTFNEAGNIVPLVHKIIQEVSALSLTFEVVIVDDSSPDRTADVARLEFENDERVLVFSRPQKLGLGTAYCFGLARSKGEHILIMDADFSHEPESIRDLLGTMRTRGSDISIGSRYMQGGSIQNWTIARRVVSSVANFLAYRALRVPLSDLTGSFRVYRREVIEACAPLVKGAGYVFQMEILVRAHRMGYVVHETPIHFKERREGVSKFGVREVYEFLCALWYLSILR